MKSGTEKVPRPSRVWLRCSLAMLTSCLGCGKGSGCRRTVLTTEKIAVFAPMPRPMAMIAMAVRLGFFHNIRVEWTRFFQSTSIDLPLSLECELVACLESKLVPALFWREIELIRWELHYSISQVRLADPIFDPHSSFEKMLMKV